jgi:hypothetical protein
MTALASASQNATTNRRRSVHQRSLPYWLAQAWVRSTTPAAPGLGRRRQPAGGDLTGHPAVGQDLPVGMVVMAGVQVDRRPGGHLGEAAGRRGPRVVRD